MKDFIFSDIRIPGWACQPDADHFTCTPSDEYIAKRAYFRFVTQNPPNSTPFAYWITAEADFIAARGNDLPPL